MYRPDLVDVWVFRVGAAGLELLMMRRSSGRLLAGLWQGVSGSVEAGERIASAARRELAEETGFDGDRVEAFYDLDLVNQFHWSPADAIMSAAVFAARVGPKAEPVLSHEHDESRWLAPDQALELIVWPAYRDAVAVIERDLLDPPASRGSGSQADGSRSVG